jgi:hypothetical protein
MSSTSITASSDPAALPLEASVQLDTTPTAALLLYSIVGYLSPLCPVFPHGVHFLGYSMECAPFQYFHLPLLYVHFSSHVF